MCSLSMVDVMRARELTTGFLVHDERLDRKKKMETPLRVRILNFVFSTPTVLMLTTRFFLANSSLSRFKHEKSKSAR